MAPFPRTYCVIQKVFHTSEANGHSLNLSTVARNAMPILLKQWESQEVGRNSTHILFLPQSMKVGVTWCLEARLVTWTVQMYKPGLLALNFPGRFRVCFMSLESCAKLWIPISSCVVIIKFSKAGVGRVWPAGKIQLPLVSGNKIFLAHSHACLFGVIYGCF